MKKLLVIARALVPAICVGTAAALVLTGNFEQGAWGWFLFVGLLTR